MPVTATTNDILTHYRLNELPHTIYSKILISILGMSGYVIRYSEVFADSGDPDQTLHSVVSDLGLPYLPVTL